MSRLLSATIAIALFSTVPWLALEAKAKPVEGVVNLNTASVAELSMLPGIGPAKAKEILTYRQAHPFTAASELTAVPGIGPKMLDRIQRYLTISGSTTIHFIEKGPEGTGRPTAPAAVK